MLITTHTHNTSYQLLKYGPKRTPLSIYRKTRTASSIIEMMRVDGTPLANKKCSNPPDYCVTVPPLHILLVNAPGAELESCDHREREGSSCFRIIPKAATIRNWRVVLLHTQ